MNRKMARALRPDAEQLAWLESRGHGHCEEATKLRIALARPVINMIPYEKPKKQQTLRRKKVLAEQD
jgi:hypothetical protein